MRNVLTPNEYSMKHTPHHTGKGGGEAIFNKSELNEVFRTFEHIECTLKSSMRIVVVYGPPPSAA